VYKLLHDHLRIDNLATAQQVVDHFLPAERELLLQILTKQSVIDGNSLREGFNFYKKYFIVSTIFRE
jgi:hypothetical protein